jgi:predicted RNA-binding protein associated with RNAse of E/G family
MPGYPPTVIDVAARTVSARDGRHYPLDRLTTTGDSLYFARRGAADPRIAYQERWLLPARGWVVIRWTLHAGAPPLGYDWYVDLDRIEVTGHCWSVSDRYLDATVREGVGYEVHDADELAEAIESGALVLSDGLAALRALDELCKSLRRIDFSVARLLEEFAPGLPPPATDLRL